MEQTGVIDSGNLIKFGKKFENFLKGKKNRAEEFNCEKNKVSSEFLNRKISLRTALIDSGSTLFVGSPLKSMELERILFEFVIDNPNNLKEAKLKPDNRIKKWKSYLDKFDEPKIYDFFTVQEDGLLKLTNEGITYVESIISKYERNVA